MGLCKHGRVPTVCPDCKPDPRRRFLEGFGPVLPHRWAAEAAKSKIRPSELGLIEQGSAGGKRPPGLRDLSGRAYWQAHDALYPGGSAQSQEWGWLREAVLERDGNRCCICLGTRTLQVDHINPLAKGGRNEFTNLWTLCKSCHQAKTGRLL